MFGWGRKRRNKRQECPHRKHRNHKWNFGHHREISLDQAEENRKYVIMHNPDRKTVEMGLFNGGVISVQKNDSTDPNLVIAVGESRYIISRKVAEKITIR